MSLPVGLVCELESALVADEGLHAAVRPHVRVQQRLTQVRLPAWRARNQGLGFAFAINFQSATAQHSFF